MDLVVGASGIEAEIVSSATRIRVGQDGSLQVASVESLIAMKVLSEDDVREQDHAELRALLTIASDAELREARRLVQVIDERGYARGKDLGARLELFVQRIR